MTKRILYLIGGIALLAFLIYLFGCGKPQQSVGNLPVIVTDSVTAAPYRVTGLSGLYAVEDSVRPTGGTIFMLFNMNPFFQGGDAYNCPRPPYFAYQIQYYIPNGNPKAPWQDRWHTPKGREWDEWIWPATRWHWHLRKRHRAPTQAVIFHVPSGITRWKLTQTTSVVCP